MSSSRIFNRFRVVLLIKRTCVGWNDSFVYFRFRMSELIFFLFFRRSVQFPKIFAFFSSLFDENTEVVPFGRK
jgi:hypothetical protein